jgi:hypothetical protein
MKAELAVTLPVERDAVARFLRTTFGDSTLTNSFEPGVLDWKYFVAHPEWNGPRSFVLKTGADIVAHGGIWPLGLVNASREVNAIHLIDWAARADAPGSGVRLLRNLATDGAPLVTIGGSENTRSILPKLGYQHTGVVKMYARVLRPWLQFRSTSKRTWKSPLRFLRSAVWSLSPLPASPKTSQVSRILRFDSSLEPLLNRRAGTDHFSSRRTLDGLNHFLNCPAATFSAFLVSEMDSPRGFFLLSQIGKQIRIADLYLATDDPEHWTQAYVLATRTAAERPETCEIVVASSAPMVQRAIEKAGFRPRGEHPIYCYDPRKLLGDSPKLNLSLLDGDGCFRSNLRSPYMT